MSYFPVWNHWKKEFLVSFCFLSKQKKLYNIDRGFGLFYDIDNILNERNQTENYYISFLFQPNLISLKMWSKNCFDNFISFFIKHDFYVLIFECITHSSSVRLEELRLFAIVN